MLLQEYRIINFPNNLIFFNLLCYLLITNLYFFVSNEVKKKSVYLKIHFGLTKFKLIML
jgi:hypothetical protein